LATVPTVAGTFSPQRPILRLDGHGYSPALLQKIVTAGARWHSFADAAFALGLSGLSISARHVQQLTQEIGTDLAQARDEQAQKRRRRELSPRVATTPEVVEVDGGRLRTRAADSGRGVHAAENKEDKIACLVTLTSVVHAEDPQPEPPPSFVQPRRIQRLVQQMAGQASDALAGADTTPTALAADEEAATPTASVLDAEAEPWSPRQLVRTCVASLVASRSFGPLMAAAQSRDFYAAQRRSFVADGQAYNGASASTRKSPKRKHSEVSASR